MIQFIRADQYGPTSALKKIIYSSSMFTVSIFDMFLLFNLPQRPAILTSSFGIGVVKHVLLFGVFNLP
jgi:hypothetical protein